MRIYDCLMMRGNCQLPAPVVCLTTTCIRTPYCYVTIHYVQFLYMYSLHPLHIVTGTVQTIYTNNEEPQMYHTDIQD